MLAVASTLYRASQHVRVIKFWSTITGTILIEKKMSLLIIGHRLAEFSQLIGSWVEAFLHTVQTRSLKFMFFVFPAQRGHGLSFFDPVFFFGENLFDHVLMPDLFRVVVLFRVHPDQFECKSRNMDGTILISIDLFVQSFLFGGLMMNGKL